MMHNIGRSIVGKLRARSYCSSTHVPAKVPAQVPNRVGDFVLGFVICASIAWLSRCDFGDMSSKHLARAASQVELERAPKADNVPQGDG